MVLGGQHISAAVLQMYKGLGGEDGDKGIPEPLQFLEAEVLKSATPLELCCLAAGEHQLEQKDVMAMSVGDAFAFYVKTCREKLTKMGTPYLTDSEVAQAGCQLGLQQYLDRNGRTLKEEQAVCFHPS